MNSESSDQKFLWNKMLPPFRFKQFFPGFYSFDFPPFKNLRKWRLRILANLLYFQTNYFFLILISCIFSSFVYQIIVGYVNLIFCGLFAAVIFSKDEKLLNIRQNYPYAIIIVLVGIIYFFITYRFCVCISIASLIFNIFTIFFHASVRSCGFNNKLEQRFFDGPIRQTIMAKMFRALNIETKIE